MDLDYLWQKLAFQIVHKTTLWLLIALFGTALASHYLALILAKHEDRGREARFAHQITAAYASIAIVLWLFSFIFD